MIKDGFARSRMNKQRVVVTGAAGFIGSHVCEALIARGATVLGVDSFDPFYRRALKEDNVRSLVGSERFTLAELDILETDALVDAMRGFDATGVIHLAARAGVRPSIADPVGYTRVNVVGTQSVLSAASASGCARVVCASSSSLYGNNEKVPFAEVDAVERPVSPYAATKRACELVGYTHHELTGLPVSMLRFFTVFGPRQRPDLAISLFLSRVARGERIMMFGDGSMSRDFTYIDDIVGGVLSAYERTDAFGYRVWNLGGDHPMRLDELIRTIGEVVGREAIVERCEMQAGDVDRTWADLTRSAEELGYRPRTAVRAGIEKQWEWMQPRLAALGEHAREG
jgi:UDP-glucuronate 4-epimerase